MAKKLALAAASLALALGAAELCSRALDWPPIHSTKLVRPAADPRLGYELVPGARGTGWGCEVSINSRGFRGPEPRAQRGAELRVVVLGDSITFGHKLAHEDTYPARLEPLLEARLAREVDVFNLGVGGYDTCQEVAFLESVGLALDPDVVVVGFCVNDLGVVTMSLDVPGLSSGLGWLDASRLVRALRSRGSLARELGALNQEARYREHFAGSIASIAGDEELARRMRAVRELCAGRDRPQGGREIPAEWYASEARVGRLEFALARLEALARQHGFRVAVVLVPYLCDLAVWRACYAVVEHLLAKHGFSAVEVASEQSGPDLERLRMDPGDPVHPGAEGHALIARRLSESLGADAR
jgi:lysophospholipase L1-like esterase